MGLGKLLAFDAEATVPNQPQSAISKLAIVNLDSSSKPSLRLFDPDQRITGGSGGGVYTGAMSFTPDGKSLAYAIRDKGVDNIWVQPLDGTAGRQITNFTSENIATFQWSPDGKTLAVARTQRTSDVVLLREK
jgi:Tol biopolymer transport system component